MLSLGVRRWQITVLFLSEAALSGIFSALGGAALGYGVVSALGAYGVVGPMAGGDKMILYPRVGFLSNNLHTPTACEVITERSRRGFSARIPFSS